MALIWILDFYGQPTFLLIVLDMLDYSYGEKVCPEEGKFLDHQPLRLNKDDLARIKKSPRRKN
jgi:hypothetical protein